VAETQRRRLGLFPAILPSVSFGLYLFGIVLIIAGLIYGATILHVSTQFIVVGTLVMLGAGIVTAVKSTRTRDPAE
jgi:hypothetical protein